MPASVGLHHQLLCAKGGRHHRLLLQRGPVLERGFAKLHLQSGRRYLRRKGDMGEQSRKEEIFRVRLLERVEVQCREKRVAGRCAHLPGKEGNLQNLYEFRARRTAQGARLLGRFGFG